MTPADTPASVPLLKRPPAGPPAVRSDDLFRGTREVVILHRDEQYRLRVTRAGKLILTK